MIYFFLLILGFLAIFAENLFLAAWISVRFRFKEEKNPSYSPNTCVIVPCKGIEKKFKENVLSICDQDYENYDIIFVTDSKKDPAYPTLEKLVGNKKNVKIVISEYIKGTSGKISALIKGVKAAGYTEVYVFADSDIKPDNIWLKNLVSHLKDEKVGATTGYRWYMPNDTRSLILSAVNMICSLSLFFQISNFTWGGSTAIRKKIFDELDIIEKWKKGFSDDLILTNALKKENYKIKVIPKCIVESPPEGNLRYIFKWSAQQLMWVKWYYSPSWFVSVIGAIGLKIVTILGFILLAFGYTIPGLLMISTIFLEIISGGIAHMVLKKLMPNPKKHYGSSIAYALVTPVIFFILAYTNFISIFQTEIKWGGRVYKKTGKELQLKKVEG